MITHLKLTDPADGLQVLLPLGNGYYFVAETADGGAEFFTNPNPYDRELIGSYVSFARVAEEMIGAGLVLEVEADAHKALTPAQGRDLGAGLLSDRMTSGDAHVGALKKTIQRLDDEKASMETEVQAYRWMHQVVLMLEAEGLQAGLKIEDTFREVANLWVAQKVEIKRLEQKERELNQRLSHTDVGRSADIIERLRARVEDEESRAEILLKKADARAMEINDLRQEIARLEQSHSDEIDILQDELLRVKGVRDELRRKAEQLSIENQEMAYRLNAPSRGEQIK